MKLVLLGAPGAGKGTQAEIISEKYNIPTISTGNIIRAALKNGTQMGLKAKAYIDSGRLVPDDVVIGIIKERLAEDDCQNGFILDGFPRTIPQAEALDSMNVSIDAALSIEVSDREIVKRMSGRRVCEKCGASYHTEYKKPKTEGICDGCGSPLIIRKDDEPDTVLDRLDIYHKQTEPLKSYYKSQGKLITVEGQPKVEDTTRLVLDTLSEI
ncbi:MAG: adenylate kinase [Phascolarctobacterium sp.]|nr:adenylate kinase [Phascolarctobacterium sp.]MBQ8338134.1 adenylate kinase [Oscillospiraceae bacterium]